MWGTFILPHGVEAKHRFIPTHVGNIATLGGLVIPPAVHPHACGEHTVSVTTLPDGNGSSPRMWGTFAYPWGEPGTLRFIPTHVGNMLQISKARLSTAVHPHACGEHFSNYKTRNYTCGSSPRMWGTYIRINHGPGYNRFIPTHVGNILWESLNKVNTPVHPHACGEHSLPLSEAQIHVGSSPRMWGTSDSIEYRLSDFRFIPTHVGNIEGELKLLMPKTVHPHACGEHTKRQAPNWHYAGSSPRMWGTSYRNTCKMKCCRFIPTHVGNIASIYRRSNSKWVHPHACGEHLSLEF